MRQLLIIPILPPSLKELVLKCTNQMLQFSLSTCGEDKRGLPFDRGTQWNIYKTLIIESFFDLHLAVFIYRQASLDYQKTRASFVFLHPIRSENALWNNNNKKNISFSVFFLIQCSNKLGKQIVEVVFNGELSVIWPKS